MQILFLNFGCSFGCGFGCGFESPEILDLYTRMAEAPDTAVATQAANEYLDYVYEWNLQPGIVAVPDGFYWNNSNSY